MTGGEHSTLCQQPGMVLSEEGELLLVKGEKITVEGRQETGLEPTAE